jgi:hypothetical protein
LVTILPGVKIAGSPHRCTPPHANGLLARNTTGLSQAATHTATYSAIGEFIIQRFTQARPLSTYDALGNVHGSTGLEAALAILRLL